MSGERATAMKHDLDCAFPTPCQLAPHVEMFTHDIGKVRDAIIDHGKQLFAAATGIDAISRILTKHMEREEQLLDSMASRMVYQIRELQVLDKAQHNTISAIGDILEMHEKRISVSTWISVSVSIANVVVVGMVFYFFHGV